MTINNARRSLLKASAAIAAVAAAPGLVAAPAGASPPPRVTVDARRRALPIASGRVVWLEVDRRLLLAQPGGTTRVLRERAPGVVAAAALAGGGFALLDRHEAHVSIHDADGTTLRSFSLADEFLRPSSLVADSDGSSLWIADSARHLLGRWDVHGRRRALWGGAPERERSPNGPMGLYLDDEQRLHSLEAGHGAVLLWSRDGALLGRYGAGLRAGVSGLVPQADGRGLFTFDRWQQALVPLTPRRATAAGATAPLAVPGLATLAHAPHAGYFLTA